MQGIYPSLLDEHKKNHRWFEKHYTELVKKYDKEYIAVYGQRMIDHDQDLTTLMKRVRSKYPTQDIFVEYVTSEKLVMVL